MMSVIPKHRAKQLGSRYRKSSLLVPVSSYMVIV